MSQYAELIAKLEAADVGSRELDAAIWGAVLHPEVKAVGWHEAYGGRGTQVVFKLPPKRTENVTSERGVYEHAAAYTTSLDAAVALVERQLPTMPWFVASPVHGWAAARLDGTPTIYAQGRTPALALCIALLRALEAQ